MRIRRNLQIIFLLIVAVFCDVLAKPGVLGVGTCTGENCFCGFVQELSTVALSSYGQAQKEIPRYQKQLDDAMEKGDVTSLQKIMQSIRKECGFVSKCCKIWRVKDDAYWFPLHAAAKHDNPSLTTYLLDGEEFRYYSRYHFGWRNSTILGQPINEKNLAGESALHIAASHGCSQVISMLLARGANPLLKNKDKQTPLDILLQQDSADNDLIQKLQDAEHAFESQAKKKISRECRKAKKKRRIARKKAAKLLAASEADLLQADE